MAYLFEADEESLLELAKPFDHRLYALAEHLVISYFNF